MINFFERLGEIVMYNHSINIERNYCTQNKACLSSSLAILGGLIVRCHLYY